MRISEVLEKSALQAIEKGKNYVLFVPEDWSVPENVDEMFADYNVLVVMVPDPTHMRLFELKEEE